MRKKNKNGKLIITTGIIAFVVVTVCAFNKEYITRKYYEYSIDKKYANANVNEYYIDDHFEYVENYSDTTINNKNEFVEYIYYALNSGNNSTERYISKDYINYNNDINYYTSNDGVNFKEIVSTLNNFVHPYNSSDNIKILYGDNYKIGIEINRAYSDKEIKEINSVVDEVIKHNITNSMPTKEKIKVIHDYIIDNAEYDKLKYENKNDTTYKSNTAYGVLIEGYGTCNGYADAMAIFLNKLNIINYKISNNEHIWNLVYLDGKWFHLDLTWDDPISDVNISRDTYFLIDTKTLEKINDGTHSFDKNIYSEAK